MKKLILLLSVITLSFNSCDSDDDSSSQDPIVGTWNLNQSFENDEEYELDNCDKEGALTFNSNGTYSSISYYTDSDDTCSVDYESTGTWENNENGVYTFIDDESDAEQTLTITFSGNTFYYTDIDGSYTYKEVYIKN